MGIELEKKGKSKIILVFDLVNGMSFNFFYIKYFIVFVFYVYCKE